jgi:hypothetical protein
LGTVGQAGGVDVIHRIVRRIRVAIPGLGIGEIDSGAFGRIGVHPAAEGGGVLTEPGVVEAGFGVALFAGGISALTPGGQEDIRVVAVVLVASSLVRADWIVSRVLSIHFARSGGFCCRVVLIDGHARRRHCSSQRPGVPSNV